MGLLARANLKLVILLLREQDNIFLARCFEPIRQYGSTSSHVESDNFLVFSMTRRIQSYLPTVIAIRPYVHTFRLKLLPGILNPSLQKTFACRKLLRLVVNLYITKVISSIETTKRSLQIEFWKALFHHFFFLSLLTKTKPSNSICRSPFSFFVPTHHPPGSTWLGLVLDFIA